MNFSSANIEKNVTTQAGYYGESGAMSPAQMGAMLGSAKQERQSPIQQEMRRQRDLLCQLDGEANGLIDPLRTALERDPREIGPATVGQSAQPVQPPPSCELESALRQSNLEIERTISRLGEIRRAICL